MEEAKDTSVSVNAIFTVVIRGATYELSRDEAMQLRDQLTLNLGDGALQSALRWPTYPFNAPSPTVYPNYPTVSPFVYTATNSTADKNGTAVEGDPVRSQET